MYFSVSITSYNRTMLGCRTACPRRVSVLACWAEKIERADLENVDLASDFCRSLDGVDIATLDELDGDFFAPPLRVKSELDFAEFALAERLQ